MPNLTNSTTSVLKATLVPLLIPTQASSAGRATSKSNYVRQLSLQSGEVNSVQQAVSIVGAATPGAITTDANFWSLLRNFEGTPLASQLPKPSAFATVQESDLNAFGNALIGLRQQQVQRLQAASTATPTTSSDNATASAGSSDLASLVNNLNTAISALTVFSTETSTSPIGMLNLERLEMTPAGIERESPWHLNRRLFAEFHAEALQ